MKRKKNIEVEISDCLNCDVFDRCFPIGGDNDFGVCINKIKKNL